LALAVAALPPLILAATGAYKGFLIWPGLVGNTTGSLIAFMLALEWERRCTHENLKPRRISLRLSAERKSSAGSASSQPGRLLGKSFSSSRKATNKSAEAGRKTRGKLPG
jgi:hypothetical protein